MVPIVPYSRKLHRSQTPGFDWSYHGTFSEQHHDVQASRRKENSRHPRNFIDLFDIHNLFKALVNELINIAAGVIASDDINVDSVVDIGTKIVSDLDDKKLGEISFKRKDQAKMLQ